MMNRDYRRSKEGRMMQDPMVLRMIYDATDNAFAHFLVNALANRPEEIEEEGWKICVHSVIEAGRRAPTEEKTEKKKTPRKKAEKTDAKEE